MQYLKIDLKIQRSLSNLLDFKKIIKYKSKPLVAVSGGPDSLALVALTKAIMKIIQNFTMF